MKKLPFVLMALVGFVLLTGCKKDPAPEPQPTYADPTLTLVSGDGFLAEGDEIAMGTPFRIGLNGTGETVAKLAITFKTEDAVVLEMVKEYEGATIAQYIETVTLDRMGDITMTAVLTDTQDKTATVTLSFKSVTGGTSTDFEGTYSGPTVLNGTADIQGLASYTLPGDTTTLTLQITKLDNGKYEGIFFYNEEEYVTTGTLHDDVLVFDPFDREIVIEDSFSLKLTLTFNFEAVRVDDKLNVSSVVTGTGNVSIPNMPVEMPCSFDGDIKGILDKTE